MIEQYKMKNEAKIQYFLCILHTTNNYQSMAQYYIVLAAFCVWDTKRYSHVTKIIMQKAKLGEGVEPSNTECCCLHTLNYNKIIIKSCAKQIENNTLQYK
jgi:hypothetical protein